MDIKLSLQADHFSIFYNFAEYVSKPKIAPNFMLPVDHQPVLRLAGSMGYDSYRPDNVHVLDSNTLLFIAGSYLRVYKLDSNENKFIRCTGTGSVACLAVAPNHAAFASGERGDKPDINIFGFPSCKLRKVLKNGTQTEYVSMMFEPLEGGLLASQGGEPDYSLTIWQWQREIPILRCKASSQDVRRVAFSEELFGSLVTSGAGHIRFWTMAITFTGLKLKGQVGRFGRRNMSDIDAFVQFADGKVLSGSENGTMLLWEETLLKAEFTRKKEPNCHSGKITHMSLYEGEILTLGEDSYVRTWSVDAVIYVDPDFHGKLLTLEPLLEIKVGEQSCLMYMTQANPQIPRCFEWYAQDKEGKIWTVDLSIMFSAPAPKVLLHYHGGPILACAISHNTHLVATAGQDCTVRIFDCLQKTALLCMTFSAPARSLLWIPLSVDVQGASVVVGFDDGVIRKLVFCGKKNPESPEAQKLEGQLSQVFKPHKSPVTGLILSHTGDVFATGSLDKTIFLFTVKKTRFEPFGWLSVPTSVKQLVWTPPDFPCQGFLAVCEDGIVVQTQLENLMHNIDITEFFELLNPRLRVFKFQSIKSEIQHAEKLTRLQEEMSRKAEEAEEAEESGEKSQETEEAEDPVLKEDLVLKEDPVLKEENWRPYYPDPPSPILQALYSEKRDCFWLTLGDYDAGYVYLCRFPDICYNGDREDMSKYLTKPEKAVAVPDCSDIPMTVLKISETRWQTLALMGFQNGRIRLVQLPHTSELDDISAYWDMNAHDNKDGSLTGMEFAFDRKFLVTTGMDGNIFVFSYTGLLEMTTKTTSMTPSTIKHHDICVDDISRDTLRFSEHIQKQKQENMLQEAEASKKQKRRVLKELQDQVTSILFKNDQLPLPYRLSRWELQVNSDLQKECSEIQQEKLAEIHRQYAWEVDKTRILLDKVKNEFLKTEDLPDQFTVQAFNRSVQIKSYRVCPSSCGDFGEFHAATPERGKTPTKQDSEENVERYEDLEDTLTETAWRNAYAMTHRRSVGLTGTVARSLKLALDRAMKANRKRQARKKKWKELYAEKAHVDKDNPEDMLAIENAKQTIGNIILKTDPSHAVDNAGTYSMASAGRSLVQLDRKCCEKKNAFNQKLMDLREEKILVLRVFHALDKYLDQMSFGTKTLASTPPQLSEDEIPEAKFVLDEQTIYRFKNDIDIPSKSDLVFHQKGTSKVQKPLYRHTYYKGERSDIPDFVQLFWKQNEEDDSRQSVHINFSGELYQEVPMSTLQEEITLFSQLQTGFQTSLMQEFVSNLIDEFDKKLRDLYREQLHLDVLLKQADLLYISKLEEFLVSKKAFTEEKQLMDEATRKQEEIEKNQATIVQLRKQIARRNEEHDLAFRKLADLWLQFQNVCVDKKGTPIMRFLTKLYKRKIYKKRTVSDDQDEDEEVSESLSVSSASDSVTDASMSMDLGYCPEELEPALYNAVQELQKHHQFFDDLCSEIKHDLVLLNKDFEQIVKEGEALKRANEKIEQRLHAFYQEKVDMMNDIITVVPLLESRINSRVSEGLVLNRKELGRLYSRVNSLEEEIKAQVLIKKRHTWKHLALRRATRLLRERIETCEKKCEEEILKKFGKPVSMVQLELIATNPKVEVLKCQLAMDKDRQMLEKKKFDRKIRDMVQTLSGTTALNTSLHQVKTDLVLAKKRLEDYHDLCSGGQTIAVEDPVQKQNQREDEMMTFSRLLHQQTSVMQGCWEEMTTLLTRGTSGANHLPPICTVQRIPGTKSLSVASGARERMLGPNATSGTKKRLPFAKL